MAGEQRFASIIARRLESLGALTHGDRRATETRDFSKYNFDNRYGRTALEIVFNSVTGQRQAIVPIPSDYAGDFFEDISEAMLGVGLLHKQNRWPYYIYEKDYNNIPKFLNRILGIPVELQNRLFAYFSDRMSYTLIYIPCGNYFLTLEFSVIFDSVMYFACHFFSLFPQSFI